MAKVLRERDKNPHSIQVEENTSDEIFLIGQKGETLRILYSDGVFSIAGSGSLVVRPGNVNGLPRLFIYP